MAQKYALAHMNPTIAMAAQGFPGCSVQDSGRGISYADVRVYTREMPLEQDILYLVQGRDADYFPGERYASICPLPIAGQADRITAPELTEAQILDRALAIFARFRQQERALDELVFEGCTLQQLCEAGSQMLENPVYIHDDWFMMLAQSSQVDDFMTPEYTMTSQRGFLPKVIVNDLQFDSDYLETYAAHDVQHWVNPERRTSCLYVNLWDGAIYRGRLLVMETNHPSRPSDIRLTQVLGQRALGCLRFPGDGGNGYHSMDNVIWDMLSQKRPDSVKTQRLLDQLGWAQEDPYVCLDVAPQEESITSIQEHSLHSDLFRFFPNSYVLLRDHRQVVVLNMRRLGIPYNMLRHTLAPLCRDHLLYAGISSPVSNIWKLPVAFSQAQIALKSCFRIRGERWIRLFSGCALEHFVDNYHSELPIEETVSPALRALQDYDKVHGTPYFETLRAYLLCERDIPRTSEMLIIHRTTLLYRLKKIGTLVSLNLDNTNQRIYLLLSLFIMDRGFAENTDGDSEEKEQLALQ